MTIDDIKSTGQAAPSGISLGRTEVGASPLFSHVWPDSEELNARLRQVVLDRKAVSPGLQKSQCGGWQSERDLQLWHDPAVKTLLDRMQAMTGEVVRATVDDPTDDLLGGWDIEAWANVNEIGDTVASHVHSGGVNMWAAIYYVDTGEGGGTASSGFTRFMDMSGIPRPVAKLEQARAERRAARSNGDRPECLDADRPRDDDLELAPLPGRMVVFPATLPHYVTAYLGDAQRITIAFNLRHTKYVVTDFENRYARRRMLWRNYRGIMLIMFEVKRKIRENLARVVPVHKWPAGLRRRLLGGGS